MAPHGAGLVTNRRISTPWLTETLPTPLLVIDDIPDPSLMLTLPLHGHIAPGHHWVPWHDHPKVDL